MFLDDKIFESLKDRVNEPPNPTTYLAVDPGKSNGFCGYDDRHHLTFMFTIPSTNMIRVLQLFTKVQIIIVENFTLFPHKRTEANYSDMETSRVIGRIESWAELNKVEIIKQGPNVKKTGYQWLGIPSPSKSNPANHELDAHCHFTYWAVKNGRINLLNLIKKDWDNGTYILQK